jgi:hypothetical protein
VGFGRQPILTLDQKSPTGGSPDPKSAVFGSHGGVSEVKTVLMVSAIVVAL